MVLIDLHVHIYNCFDLKKFFSSTQENFQIAAKKISNEGKYTGILLLTDWAGQDWFQKISQYIKSSERECESVLGDRRWSHSEENHYILFEDSNGNKIYVISGRKIITSENLEVLALPVDKATFKDGQSLLDTVKAISANQSVPLVPWAVGKWLGKRGRVLDDLISEVDANKYFLCDNGNRPFFWSKPNHFSQVENRGGKILSGSDPLHFPSEMDRAGRFGCWVDCEFDSNFPAKWLKSVLEDPSVEVKSYGELDTSWRFIRNQFAMQLLKRKWKSTYYRQ